MDDFERLRQLVSSDEGLMRALRAVRSVGMANWVIGSGAIRNLVWDSLHGYAERTPLNDVDVAYFDPMDVTRARDADVEARLAEIEPGIPWEVTNQAGVHLWYEAKFGHSIRQLTSTEDALSTWPETATCVGVRLEADDSIVVVAPLGLDDLFDLVLRRNPVQVSREFFLERVAAKRLQERWPKVTLVED